MDTNQVKDILPLIFNKLKYSTNYKLVCRFWHQIYKNTIATQNILLECRKKSSKYLVKISEVHSLNIDMSDIENFNYFANIRYLSACGCIDLHKSSLFSYNLEKLVKLNISRCYQFIQLPNLIHLEELSMAECDEINNIEILSNFKKLKILNIGCCQNIIYLPKLYNLEILYASECENLINIDGINYIKKNYETSKIKKLYLNFSLNIEEIPSGLENLEVLEINECKNLKITEIYKKLRKLNINYNNIDKLPNLPNLEILHAEYCANLANINGIGNKIKEIYISDSYNITELPHELDNLEKLGMVCCDLVSNIDILKNCSKLKYLDIRCCDQITELPNINSSVILYR